MNPWRGLFALPRRVWLLCGCTLVNRMGSMAFPFLALFLVQGRGWTPQQAATGMLVFGAGSLMAAPVAGPLADRLGHGRVLRFSMWGSGLMLLILPFARSTPALFAAILTWAVLTQAFWPSSMALLAGLAPVGQRKAVFALHRLVSNLGMAIGPALGGFIAMYGFSWVFWVDGLTTLASACLLTVYFQRGPEPMEVPAPPPKGPDRTAWKDRHLHFLLLAFLPVLMVFCQMNGVLPLWVVRNLGFTPRFFGLIFTLNTLLIVLLEVALNLAMARWPHQRQFTLGAALVAVGFGLTGLARSHSLLLVTVAIWTFGEMILLPAMADAVATLAPAHRRGEYMGLYSLTFAVGFALGPWLGVTAYAQVGPGLVWGVCGGVGLFSAFMLSRFRI